MSNAISSIDFYLINYDFYIAILLSHSRSKLFYYIEAKIEIISDMLNLFLIMLRNLIFWPFSPA